LCLQFVFNPTIGYHRGNRSCKTSPEAAIEAAKCSRHLRGIVRSRKETNSTTEAWHSRVKERTQRKTKSKRRIGSVWRCGGAPRNAGQSPRAPSSRSHALAREAENCGSAGESFPRSFQRYLKLPPFSLRFPLCSLRLRGECFSRASLR
jgi:hypothetical protein